MRAHGSSKGHPPSLLLTNQLAPLPQTKVRNTRYQLVKNIEDKLAKQNLNKTIRRYRDRENRCRASEWCGRLSVIAHEADNVRGKDNRTNAFLRFRIGGKSFETWKRTETVKNSTLSPDFADEKVSSHLVMRRRSPPPPSPCSPPPPYLPPHLD